MQPGFGQAGECSLVGVGASTVVGRTAPASCAAVRAGVARIGEHPFLVDSAGEPMVVARASYIEGETAVERMLALAVQAAREALTPLAALRGRVPAIPVLLSLPPQRPGLPATLPQVLAEGLRAALQNTEMLGRIDTIPFGHSAGLVALERATLALRGQRNELYLIGGVDSYLDPETLEWLEGDEQLHRAGRSNNAWGFIPGEAAGFCLLASTAAQVAYAMECRCRVIGVATAMEPNRIKTDSVCIGHGLSDVVRRVSQQLPPGTQIDDIYCDMNGEPYRADEWGFTLARLSERFMSGSRFVAPADCWGDVGAASAPLYMALAEAAARRGYARGPHTLIWTSSESGVRGSALLCLDTPSRGPHERYG